MWCLLYFHAWAVKCEKDTAGGLPRITWRSLAIVDVNIPCWYDPNVKSDSSWVKLSHAIVNQHYALYKQWAMPARSCSHIVPPIPLFEKLTPTPRWANRRLWTVARPKDRASPSALTTASAATAARPGPAVSVPRNAANAAAAVRTARADAVKCAENNFQVVLNDLKDFRVLSLAVISFG